MKEDKSPDLLTESGVEKILEAEIIISYPFLERLTTMLNRQLQLIKDEDENFIKKRAEELTK